MQAEGEDEAEAQPKQEVTMEAIQALVQNMLQQHQMSHQAAPSKAMMSEGESEDTISSDDDSDSDSSSDTDTDSGYETESGSITVGKKSRALVPARMKQKEIRSISTIYKVPSEILLPVLNVDQKDFVQRIPKYVKDQDSSVKHWQKELNILLKILLTEPSSESAADAIQLVAHIFHEMNEYREQAVLRCLDADMARERRYRESESLISAEVIKAVNDKAKRQPKHYNRNFFRKGGKHTPDTGQDSKPKKSGNSRQ